MRMRLKQLREQKNISQQKLAIALAMNQNTISRYETGEREADYSTLIKIADILMYPLIICSSAPIT